jgi:hypothetical protein
MELDQPPSESLPTCLRHTVLLPDIEQAKQDGNDSCTLMLAGHSLTASIPPSRKWSRLAPFLNVQGQLGCSQHTPAALVLACDAFLADCLSLADLRTLRRVFRRHDYGPECTVQNVRMLINLWWDYVAVALVQPQPGR